MDASISGWLARGARLLGPIAAMWTTTAALAQPCAQEWEPVGSGVEGQAFADFAQCMAVFDDGQGGGPALYVGGAFTVAGGVPAGKIAKWDGTSWSDVGGGMNMSVIALTIFDDGQGGGPALYAGGSFTAAGGQVANKVAKWDGTTWTALGTGMSTPTDYVFALAGFDDGTGPALYAAGRFTEAGGVPCNRIAKWDGATWSPVGANDIDLVFYALTVFDDGQGGGPALYAGGHLNVADGTAVNKIARWNGTTWSAVGSGLDNFPLGLVAYDDGLGGGPALVAGGAFTMAGGAPANRVAKWDGVSWSALGSGMDDDVRCVAVFDDGRGGGPELYAGGDFTSAGGVAANHLAKWDGHSWSPLGAGVEDGNTLDLTVYTLGGYSHEGVPALYAGGEFFTAGGVSANHITRWICNPTGACCLPSGACEARTQLSCSTAGGMYNGDGTECGSIPPCPQPPTGACCLPSGCMVMWAGGCAAQGGIYQGDDTVCGTGACDAFAYDAEPNNVRAEANAVVLADGHSIVGISTGEDTTPGSTAPETVDYFRVRTTPAPLGIYRHRMRLHNSTPGNTGSVRTLVDYAEPGVWPCALGVDITALGFDVGSLNEVDGSDAINDWYGFGREEEVYYRVAGHDTSTGVYVATLQTTQIEPADLGAFAPGEITITTTDQGHDNDTAVSIFNSNLEPIAGYSNDDASINGGAPMDLMTTSFLRRTYEPGTYYMAIAIGYLATNLGSPCDDNQSLGLFMDFPDAVLGVDDTDSTATDASFSVTDAGGTTPIAAQRPGRGQVAWFRFSVGTACAADFNADGSLNSQDFFDFLAAFFEGASSADFNHDDAVNSQDFFDFLSAFFNGC